MIGRLRLPVLLVVTVALPALGTIPRVSFALADISLGKTAEWLSQPPVSLLTASLTVDFYSAARRGDWLKAETDVTRVGHQVAFRNCYLRIGDKIVARASGVFKVLGRAPKMQN
jgi:acyl-coenzyme A thioesterase PaaI-like protein